MGELKKLNQVSLQRSHLRNGVSATEIECLASVFFRQAGPAEIFLSMAGAPLLWEGEAWPPTSSGLDVSFIGTVTTPLRDIVVRRKGASTGFLKSKKDKDTQLTFAGVTMDLKAVDGGELILDKLQPFLAQCSNVESSGGGDAGSSMTFWGSSTLAADLRAAAADGNPVRDPQLTKNDVIKVVTWGESLLLKTVEVVTYAARDEEKQKQSAVQVDGAFTDKIFAAKAAVSAAKDDPPAAGGGGEGEDSDVDDDEWD